MARKTAVVAICFQLTFVMTISNLFLRNIATVKKPLVGLNQSTIYAFTVQALVLGSISTLCAIVGICLVLVRLDSIGEGLYQRLLRKFVAEPQRTEKELHYIYRISQSAVVAVGLQSLFNSALIAEILIRAEKDYQDIVFESGFYQLFSSSFFPFLAVILLFHDCKCFRRDITRVNEAMLLFDGNPADDIIVLRRIDQSADNSDRIESAEVLCEARAGSMQSEPQESDELRYQQQLISLHKQCVNQWSAEQRNFVIQLSMLILIINVGGRIFSALEGWSFEMSTYFCIVTLTTIGYGNVSPKTQNGRLFFCMYVFLSLGLMASLLSGVGNAYVIITRLFVKNRMNWFRRLVLRKRAHLTPLSSRRTRIECHFLEFIYKRLSTLVAILFGLMIWIAGSLFFMVSENWSFLDSFYFCLQTLSTIGFGDLSPTSALGNAFLYWFVFIGVASFTTLLSACWHENSSPDPFEESS